MKLEQLNIEIIPKPLSTKQSRLLNERVQKFASKYSENESSKASVSEWEAGRFLAEQTLYLLSNIYGCENLGTLDEFEDKVTTNEVLEFLSGQVAVNGNDFLIQPLNAMIQGMQKVTDSVKDIVDAQADKIKKDLIK